VSQRSTAYAFQRQATKRLSYVKAERDRIGRIIAKAHNVPDSSLVLTDAKWIEQYEHFVASTDALLDRLSEWH